MKALARLAGPVPGHDHPIEPQDLLLEAEQLSAERGKARAGNLRHPFVARVGNNMQQFRDTLTPDRRDNAELGEVRSDRINHRVVTSGCVEETIVKDLGRPRAEIFSSCPAFASLG
jgi:hypothetical protein